MAFIDIHTNNLSRELTNSRTFIDNWAYVPGTSITGDYKQLYAFEHLQDFKDTCGNVGPEGSRTFEYVSGLLSAGIPVLFRRIACIGQDTSAETLGVQKAEVILTHEDPATGGPHNDVKICEKFGGSFGNNLSINIKNTGKALYLEVFNKYTLLEKVKIINLITDEDPVVMNKRIIEALKTLEFQRIEVEVLDDTPATFALQTVSNKQLENGKDFNETLVAAEIPNSYNILKDKILYQPKFLTAGGYTDADMTQEAPIANAMLEITRIRQDCRALIDLPIGTPADEQQDLAASIAYQQLSNGVAIPSGMICAPWQYMQVGTEQTWMPPSYVYLTVMGNSLSKGDPCYTPKAGITTGQVANVIRPEFEIGSDLAERWQSESLVNINPIMRLQGGRYVIAGNSTLLLADNVSGENNAFAESSVDLAVIEIRRFVYNLSTELQYQYNSHTAFETFALRTSNFLNGMLTEGALTDFNIYNISDNNEPRKLKVRIDVFMTPSIKSIEIYLNVSYGNIEITTGGEG